jgi:[protein-PII] uridylyltransferase
VGSHGRGEAAPGSDLDLVLLHGGRRDIASVAEGVWYPIWDRGLSLDHSVRTVKEALAAAADDLKVALGLLDARVIAGDAALFAELRLKSQDQWRRHAKRRLPELLDATAERHARFGDVAFLLEPEVKEGEGGLRDVVVLRALAAASGAAGDAASSPRVRAANQRLLAVRAALHDVTGRSSDRLAFDAQDAVASAMGLADADALMSQVSESARSIAYAFSEARHRVQSALAGSRRRAFRREARLGAGLAFRDGEVALAAEASPVLDPTLVLRAAAAAVEHGKRLGQWTLERLAAETKPPPVPWPPGVLDAFLELLDSGHDAIPVIEALDQYRLMELYVPEWETVRFRHQRNAFHRFTVDRHLLEAAAEAASLVRNVSRPDLLLVGALLHDLGKGIPSRDHTEAGIDLARVVAPRMGFGDDDVEVLVDMVRLHLLLPEAATRRDLSDAATIEKVAEQVGDRTRLELLAALTEADSKATGPAAWSAWKAGLLAELVRRVEDVFAGRPLPPPPALDVPALPDGEAALVTADGASVTVVARDRPGLFADVAGTLTLCGLDVHAAVVAGDASRGVAVERFEVETVSGDPPDWPRFERELQRVLAGEVDLAARLVERDRAYGRRTFTAAPPRVIVDDSLVEVRAPDVPGALWHITSALASCGLDIRWARVNTLGHDVVDTFSVTGEVDPAKLQGEVLSRFG